MEERLSWRESFSTAWNNLTGVNNEGGSLPIVRGVFFTIFLAGTALAGYFFWQGQTLLEPPEFDAFASPQGNSAQIDRQRLDEMLRQVDVTSKMRSSSLSMAQNMESLSMSPYPFGDPLLAIDPEPTEEEPLVLVEPEVIIDYPPEITLKAIMIVGKQRVAVMDISGVGSGMIVKAGDTFMQKKGSIVRIAPEKVVVRWGGKNWDIAPSF
ncbi:MAG: hypothetical protein LBP21_06295 [Synergistaceae bacterium]|jgi:hypothetical protein|nr:hypothetical protein [Synergistaceae bacterium]